MVGLLYHYVVDIISWGDILRRIMLAWNDMKEGFATDGEQGAGGWEVTTGNGPVGEGQTAKRRQVGALQSREELHI
jgi:hypothetical protein